MNSDFDTLIITHGHGCIDGTSSAWVVKQYLRGKDRNIRYVFASKRNLDQDIMPLTRVDLEDKDIFITDYMYTYDVLKDIAYKSLTIIDHHESAKDECRLCEQLPNTRVIFNQEYSGAGLAWISLMDENIPWWIQYIQDRDLWKWKLPHSREINDAMYNLGYRSFAKFDELHLFTDEQKEDLIKKGKEINEPKMKIVKAIADNASKCIFRGYQVFVVQSRVLLSEVGEYLYTVRKDECDFVLFIEYRFEEKYWKVSARSHAESIYDLSILCKEFASEGKEGGGHVNASGFIYKGDLLSLFIPISNEK